MAENSEDFRVLLDTTFDINKIKSQLNNIKGLTVKVDVDTSGIKRSIQKAIQEASKGAPNINIGANTSSRVSSSGASNTATQIERINNALDNKSYEVAFARIEAGFRKMGDSASSAAQRLNDVRSTYQTLSSSMKTGDVDKAVAAHQLLDKQLKALQADLSITTYNAQGYDKAMSNISRIKLMNYIQDWLSKNTAATKEAREQMHLYYQELQSGGTLESRGKEIRSDIDSTTSLQRQMGRLGNSPLVAFQKGISKFGSWIGASTVVMKTLNEIRKGIQTITELDAALTNINYTMDVSSTQLRNIGNSSFEMAKNLKTSTSNVLQALTLYANANETADSILEKTKTAVMLSNVSGISASDTADMLQGVSEQFEIEQTVEGLNHISDVIQNVSQNLAYDFTKGIGAINEAVSNSGSVAHMAGLSLEEYSAMVGKTIEVTRQAGSTVGNAYKTIFSRITKASAAEGTSEEDISKAEESLRAVNIEVRKNATEFRDVTDILSDLGKVWNDLSSVEQSNISYNLAGTRQTNILKSLLNGWQDYTDLVEKAYDAQGTTLENQEKYAESYKGHLQDLKATSESFWNNILNSGTLKVGIDSLTTILKLLDGISKTFGSLGTIGVGAGIFAGIKNVGRGKTSPLTLKYADYYMCFIRILIFHIIYSEIHCGKTKPQYAGNFLHCMVLATRQ